MLAELQNILARLIRDKAFNSLYIEDINKALSQYKLTDEERDYLFSIVPSSMNFLQERIAIERLDHRSGEFGLFIEEISRYCDYQDLSMKFCFQYNTGSLQKLSDVRCYYEFFAAYLLSYTLPEYLYDILQYCYKNTLICWESYTPKNIDQLNHIDTNTKIHFIKRHDIVCIGIEAAHLLGLEPDKKRLDDRLDVIICKNPNTPKTSSCTIIYPGTIFDYLVHQKSCTVGDIVDRFGINAFREQAWLLEDGLAQGFLTLDRCNAP
ncbi:hypothetical protein [Candidatus Sororendozoicomonas aggregata]|uniref:hypothetical protein n=1 Tax=Candidatus Sororendozoicomonas aggregata TaxID=3073239 RepID=UPI002ED2ADAB